MEAIRASRLGRNYHHPITGWKILFLSRRLAAEAFLIALFPQYYGTFSCKGEGNTWWAWQKAYHKSWDLADIQ